MLSAFKKFGKNVKKAGKNMEDKLEKAGTAMKDATARSPSKQSKKDDHKSGSQKDHDDETKSKKSKKSTRDDHSERGSKAATDAHSSAVSVHASEAHSSHSSAAPVPKKHASSQPRKSAAAKGGGGGDVPASDDADKTQRSEKTPPSPPAEAAAPQTGPAKTHARVSSPSPSDIAFEIDDVSPGPSLERAPSVPASRSSSIVMNEEPSLPQANTAPTAAVAATASAEVKRSSSSSIDFLGEDPVVPAEAETTSHVALDETARGTSAEEMTPATNAADTANDAGTKPARGVSASLRTTKSDGQRKRQVTVGDRQRPAPSDRTDATFARTEAKRSDKVRTDVPAVTAKPTSDARYRSHTDSRPRRSHSASARKKNDATPERPHVPAPRAPEVEPDLPDNSSTYVSPARLGRRDAAASSDGEVRSDDGVDHQRRDRRHRHRRHSTRDQPARVGSTRNSSVPSTRGREWDEDARRGIRRTPSIGEQGSARPQSRMSRGGDDLSYPGRSRRQSADGRSRHSDLLDYREMMEQCRREARALSRRRATRISYDSDNTDDEEPLRTDYGDDNSAYGYPSVSRRRRHRAFRDDDDNDGDPDEYDDDRDFSDGEGDDLKNSGKYEMAGLQDVYEHTPHQREHYRGRRRFPSPYVSDRAAQHTPGQGAIAAPDPTHPDRTNIGRFYPSLIVDGSPSHPQRYSGVVYRDQYSAHRRPDSRRASPDHSGRSLSSARRPMRSPPRPQSPRGGYSGRASSLLRSPLRRRPSDTGVSPYDARPLIPATHSTALSPVRRRSTSALSVSVNKSQLSEEALLDEVEFKMALLAEQIAFEDETREADMRSSPFERLYHMNNRRDRDERRSRLAQYHKLQKIRDKLLSGALEEELAAREAKRAADEARLDDPAGVFNRLYNSPRRRSAQTSARGMTSDGTNTSRRGTPLRGATGGPDAKKSATQHSRSSSANGSNVSGDVTAPTPRLSSEAVDALCTRLYGGAVAATNRREEMREEAVKQREYQEMENFLVGRLMAQMERRLNGRVLTADELQARAREELHKRMQADRPGTEKALLHGSRLTKSDMEAQARRLLRHGYISSEALAARKAERELNGCTFEPSINEYYFYSANADRDESGGADEPSRGDDHLRSPNTTATADSTKMSLSARGGTAGRRPQRTDMLYERAEKERRSAELRRQEYDREMRLKILRSRMDSDHHFRRRVELDPGLAERFMKSIVL